MSAAGADPGWRAEADRRIAAVRMGECRLRLHAPGAALAGARVEATQVRSRFGFGFAVTPLLLSETPEARRYRGIVLDLASLLVSENEMKWYTLEKTAGVESPGTGEELAAFCAEHRLPLRGHCLFWDKTKFVQPWVQALPAADLRAAVERHLERTVRRFAGKVVCWDVDNEMLDGSFYPDRLGPDIRAWMFRRAGQLDPAARLFVNEYGILDSDEKLARYRALIDGLLAQGAPIGGIGIQEHAAERFAPNAAGAAADADRPERAGRGPLIPHEVWARLDRLAAYALPIHITEVSSKTADQQRRADTLEMFLRVAYAHPAVEAFLLWGFWERSHWLGRDAALYAADFTPLPAGERVARLLRDEWRTRAVLTADADGTVTLRGFHGDYQLTVTAGDRVLRGTAALAPGIATGEVALR